MVHLSPALGALLLLPPTLTVGLPALTSCPVEAPGARWTVVLQGKRVLPLLP